MKIISGISNVTSGNEIKAYIDAGVDEFFIGYIPEEWSNMYGWEVSCNRREISYYHYTKHDELNNVVNMIHNFGKKVFLTFNAHEYNKKQIQLLLKIIESINDIPIDAYIISNLALMLIFRELGIKTPINISIGGGCNTFEAILFYIENIENIGRIILPRKLTILEIEDITNKANERNIKLEAFGLSDPCYFNDEYCFTWHGAMQPSLCQSPFYQNKQFTPIIASQVWKKDIQSNDINLFFRRQNNVYKKVDYLKKRYNQKYPVYIKKREDSIDKMHLINRIGKCGLCAFEKFKQFGIEAIKLPLRGHHISGNLELIKITKQVIDKKDANPHFCQSLLKAPGFCSGLNCFYNYPYNN